MSDHGEEACECGTCTKARALQKAVSRAVCTFFDARAGDPATPEQRMLVAYALASELKRIMGGVPIIHLAGLVIVDANIATMMLDLSIFQGTPQDSDAPVKPATHDAPGRVQ